MKPKENPTITITFTRVEGSDTAGEIKMELTPHSIGIKPKDKMEESARLLFERLKAYIASTAKRANAMGAGGDRSNN